MDSERGATPPAEELPSQQHGQPATAKTPPGKAAGRDFCKKGRKGEDGQHRTGRLVLYRCKKSRGRLSNAHSRQTMGLQDMARQQHTAMKNIVAPLSINPMEAQMNTIGNNRNMPTLMSPTAGVRIKNTRKQWTPFQYSMMSPSGSIASSVDSPPASRPSMNLLPGGQRSPDQYQPNIMNLRPDLAPATPVSVDPARKQVILSMDAYHNLVQMAGSKSQDESEPPHKRSMTSFSGEIAMPQPRTFNPAAMMPSVTSAFSAFLIFGRV